MDLGEILFLHQLQLILIAQCSYVVLAFHLRIPSISDWCHPDMNAHDMSGDT